MTKNLTVNRQNDLFLTVKGIPPPNWDPHATETGISSGLMSHLVRMQTLPLP